MDLNHITLPINTIADFYSNVLVLPESADRLAESAIEKQRGASQWPSLGANAKQVLVVVNNPAIDFLTDQEYVFLSRILAPCKLERDDIAIVNKASYQGTGAKEIITHFRSQKVLLFGITPVDFGLPVSFPEFQVQGVQGVEYLWGPPLSELEKADAQKRKLWESLKKLFNL